jgi:hypothetical protein
MSRESILFTALAVPFLSLVVYVGGYFACSEMSIAAKGLDTILIRWFDSEWLERAYGPAVKAEAFLTGWNVSSRQTSSLQPLADNTL